VPGAGLRGLSRARQIRELRARALVAGIGERAVEEALDAEEPRTALVGFGHIVALH
jgi:hypothetical protein